MTVQHVHTFVQMYIVCTHMIRTCSQSPSNHSFYRFFISYRISVGDYDDKGGHRQTNQLHDINWDAFDHASCAPQFVILVCKLMHMCMWYNGDNFSNHNTSL